MRKKLSKRINTFSNNPGPQIQHYGTLTTIQESYSEYLGFYGDN